MFYIPDSLLRSRNERTIIAFEGVDGCGKTTLCEYFAKYSDRFCFACIPEAYTQKPFKDHLVFHTTHISSALIYAGSLVDRKKLYDSDEQKRIAVLDRSFWSTLALLYARRPDAVQTMIDVFSTISDHLPIPDVVYVLDVPFEVCRERIKARKPNVKKYDDMTFEEYEKHLEFYHLLEQFGVNIKFMLSENMSYEEEMQYVLEDLKNEK